jgi:hypothetical protein
MISPSRVDLNTSTALPVFYGGLREEQLLPFFQSQLPEHAQGCGPFSIAMAANLCNYFSKESNYKGEAVEALLERKGLKIHGFGMPTWLGYGKALREFAPGKVEYKSHASIQDLEQAISNNKLPVVAIAWQTTWEILRDLRHASVGHYMVAVGYELKNERIYFLNPALSSKEGIEHLCSWTDQEFDKAWNGTRNIFIRPGSMWTIRM